MNLTEQQEEADFWKDFDPIEPCECELIHVDFVTGLGEIGREYI